jgi:ribosomal protein L37E
MSPCPNCHSPEFTPLAAAQPAKPVSLLARMFGSRPSGPVETSKRRCNFCGTVYTPDDLPDADEQRLEERRARMEERMSGFRDSAVTSSMFADIPDDPLALPAKPAGKTPPKPYRAPTLEELSKVAADIEMQKPEGVKCRKCGYFAFMVRTPESRCAGCGRIYTKMDEEAEAERQEAIRRAEAGGKGGKGG